MPSERRTRLERYFALDSANAMLALDLALACIEEGDADRASEILEAASQLPDCSPAQLNDLGLMMGSQGQWSQAIRVLEAAIGMDSSSPDLHFNLGYAQLSSSQPGAAMNSFRRSVEFHPANGRSHFYLGLASYEAGDPAAAREAFEKAIQLEPANRDTVQMLGTLAYEAGDSDKVRQHADTLLTGDTGAARDGMWLKAQAALLDLDLDDALEWLRKIELLTPNDADLQLSIAQICLGKLQPEEAKASFTRAIIGGVQNTADAHVGLGWCALLKDDLGEAEKALGRAVQLDGDSADAHAGLALVYGAKGDGQSQFHLRRALELNPNHPVALSLRSTNGAEHEKMRDAQHLRALLEDFAIVPGRRINMLRAFPNTKLGKRILGSKD